VLLGSLAGSVVGFVLLAVANSLPMVFLSRVIDGVSAGNTSTARAAIADLTSRQARATGIGVTFAMESLGLILGPVLGGVFAAYGLTVSAYVATAIAVVCLALTLVAFPETRTAHVSTSASRGDVLAALRQRSTRPLVLVVFAIQLLIMLMWGSLALYAHDLFGFGGQEMGYVSAFAATVGVLSQVAVLRILVRALSEQVCRRRPVHHGCSAHPRRRPWAVVLFAASPSRRLLQRRHAYRHGPARAVLRTRSGRSMGTSRPPSASLPSPPAPRRRLYSVRRAAATSPQCDCAGCRPLAFRR
jgi:MFS family permease